MVMRALRFGGALAILAVGAVHLQQYVGSNYRAIPTVGTLFLLNAISSAIVGVGLLLPIERVAGARRAGATLGIVSLAAIAIAAGSLVALFISETGSLFGFSESGYATPIVIAIITEAATIALLGPVASVSLRGAVSRQRRETTRRRGRRLRYTAAK